MRVKTILSAFLSFHRQKKRRRGRERRGVGRGGEGKSNQSRATRPRGGGGGGSGTGKINFVINSLHQILFPAALDSSYASVNEIGGKYDKILNIIE